MISCEHRCIFIHIPKTGGSSLENLIWPETPERPRRVEDLWMGFVDKFHNKYQTGGLQHLTARLVRQEVGETVFDRYFKFAFVRNPWDKVISQFTFMQKRKDLRSFIGMGQRDCLKRYLELIARKPHVQWLPQIDFLYDEDGSCMVDYIGRFEQFPTSVEHILRRLALPAGAIPHEKRGARGRYQDYYDAESQAMVEALYAADIERFGYCFDAEAGSRA